MLKPLLLAAALSCAWPAAAADDVMTLCTNMAVHTNYAVRATRACSDAFHVRRDIDEADAVCKGADMMVSQATEEWFTITKDPRVSDVQQCRDSYEARARTLLDAGDYLLLWTRFRIDRRTPAPSPFPLKPSLP